MAQVPVNNSTVLADEVCKDEEIRNQKEKILKRQTWGNTLNVMQNVTGLFGGPIWQAGLMGIAVAMTTVGLAGVASSLWALAGAGLALSVVGMAVNYIASKHYQDINFDTMEIGADRAAKHLVKELKSNSMCLVEEHPQNCRKDGKPWVEVQAKRALVAAQPQPEAGR